MSTCVESAYESMLHAYELGLLDDEDRQRLEMHILDCEHCYHKARNLESAMELLTKDDSIRNSILGLQPQVDDAKITTSSSAHLIGAIAIQWKKYAIAAVIIIATTSAIMRFSAPGPAIIQVDQTIFLLSTRTDETPVLYRSIGGSATIQFVYEQAQPELNYDVLLVSTSADTISVNSNFSEFNRQGLGNISILVEQFSLGEYKLLLRQSDGSFGLTLRQYSFRIEQ
jgi:hypothetical protein